MIVGKEFRFPVDVQWSHGRVTRVVAPERPDVGVAAPRRRWSR